jgi:hypothetical protein
MLTQNYFRFSFAFLNLKRFFISRYIWLISRDFVVCFLVYFDRSEVPPHTERVRLLLKLCFLVNFFYFRFSA